jgi:broad-specificity NMP kinase
MKIVEITGISGVGKSYIISIISKNKNIVLDTTLIEKYHLHDLKLTFYFFKNKNSLQTLLYIIKSSFLLDLNILYKLNFIRNSIKKIGKDYFFKYKLQNKENIILVDEGIIHLFQNIVSCNKSNKQNILNIINKIIDLSGFSNKIILVDATDNIIKKRLQKRGHTRLKNLKKINIFVENSRKNIIFLKKTYSTILIFNDQVDNKKIKDIINGIF